MRDGGRAAYISSAFAMRRSDKQADRVEIHPEQLSAAAMEAERLALKLQRPIQVKCRISLPLLLLYLLVNYSYTHQSPSHTHELRDVFTFRLSPSLLLPYPLICLHTCTHVYTHKG